MTDGPVITDAWWNAGNAASRRRLAATVRRLRPEEYQQSVDAVWTVAATLAHLAWWDDYLVARWAMVRSGQDVAECPESLEIVLNAAGSPQWLALPPEAAVTAVTRAAAAVDALIETLTADEIAWALGLSRLAMLDRARHRNVHLDELDRCLGFA